jgi:hypothetical protein
LLAKEAATAAVPAGLAASVKGAAVAATGKGLTAAAVSTQAGTLADAVVKSLLWAKLKVYGLVVASAAVVTAVPAYIYLHNDGLVGHYAFSEGTGSRAADASGTRNHGTLMGGVTWTAGPRPGSKALSFDGTGLVKLDKDVVQWLGATATVAFWIKTTQAGGNEDASSPAIIGAEVAGNNDIEWGWLHVSGRIGVVTGGGTAEKPSDLRQPSAQSKQPINDGVWHHVAMTRDFATGEVRMYVDGVFQGTAMSGQGIKTCSLTEIGRLIDRNRTMYYFRGALGDLRLYSRVLSAEEIRRLVQ